jgi:hypothetical protein
LCSDFLNGEDHLVDLDTDSSCTVLLYLFIAL